MNIACSSLLLRYLFNFPLNLAPKYSIALILWSILQHINSAPENGGVSLQERAHGAKPSCLSAFGLLRKKETIFLYRTCTHMPA